jgi:alkyl hydroperoxide reductase subunit F
MADIEIYSMKWCPYCLKAKALLQARDIPYRETDITYDEDLQLEMVERTGRYNVPQIFVEGVLVGGYEELAHINSTGTLDRAVGRKPAKLKSTYDVAVIGGGPAGLSAAMYTARKNLSTIVVTGDVGGQVGTTRDIANYPGFASIAGPELAERMIAQSTPYDMRQLIGEYVTGLRLDGPRKVVELESGREVRARALIIASGVQKRYLGIAGEAEFDGRGVVYCSTCDGPLFKDKAIAVVGGGNSAVEAALEMNGIAHEVYLVSRGEVSADAVLKDHVATAKRVKHLRGYDAVAIDGEESVESLTIRDRKRGKLRRLTVDGVFVEIGLEPNTDFALGFVAANNRGELKVDARGRTDVPGVFAAGDCTDVPDKQIVVAAGDGAKAALAAFEYLVAKQ